MKRRNRDGSSTIALSNTKGTRRVLMAGLAMIAAMILVLTLAIRPAAFADNEQANTTTVGKPPLASGLVPGQIGGSGSATVLMYMNGSDLESEAGEATSDIAEMIDSGIGANVNVVIETLGTSEWQDYDIASDHTQRYVVNQGKLQLVDDSLGQLDTTDPQTLSDFISWGVKNYPADRYILLFWDHGAGPVYGFGYDEFQSEESALTLDEMKKALDANSDVHFDIIGMDCCIMGSLETCLVLQPYCDYMVVSEDFEPGIGWSYKGWMNMLEQNPGVDTVELGKVIVDDMIADVAADEENGDATMALIDESQVGNLYSAWVNFAYANESQLLGTNYSQETEWRDRPGSMRADQHACGPNSASDDASCEDCGTCQSCQSCQSCCDEYDWERLWEDWDYDGSYVTMTDYFVTDIMEVASSIDSNEATALATAFENAMVHYNGTAGEAGMSGLGVTLPYADGEFYDELVKVFKACGIDNDYVDWLEAFVDAEGVGSAYSDDYGYGYDDATGYGYDGAYGHGNAYGYDSGYGYGYGYDDAYGYDNAYGYDDAYGYDNSYGSHRDDSGYGSYGDSAYGQGGYGSNVGKPEWSGGPSAGSGHHHHAGYAA